MKFVKYVCVFFSCCLPIPVICVAKLDTPNLAEIPHMRMWYCSIHVFLTPLSLMIYFSWESLSGHSNRSNPFCPIRKSDTQLCIWNHAHRTVYMKSRLKTTHHLFKWCRQLKAVFFAVYWLHVLASLNNFLSNASLFVDFYYRGARCPAPPTAHPAPQNPHPAPQIPQWYTAHW